jgi:hypothetical protein
LTLLPAALGQRANHDIQRNIVTAHNDKIGRVRISRST